MKSRRRILGFSTTTARTASERRFAPRRADAPRIGVVETALQHSIGGSAEQAYQRNALVARRRVLMADWGEFCAGNRPANVLRTDVGRQRPAPQSDD
jgi:hypothetical protein